MQISIINDCFDEDAKIRQVSRVGALFQSASVNCFAVNCELEAAGLMVDALDAFERRPGIILANVAPRNGEARKWKNGTPFGYFRFGETIVVSSVDGLTLSLCKRLDLINEFRLFDIAEVMDSISDEELDDETKKRIINTQFRSFNFLPRAAQWIWKGSNIPSKEYNLSDIEDTPDAVWFIDNFGNVKTTLISRNFSFKDGEEVEVFIKGKEQKLEFYKKLKDLPDKKIGLVEGSSGIGDKRFLEIILQGGNAAEKIGLQSGDLIKI